MTLSIGFCIAAGDCYFTDAESLNLAERAKNFAAREKKDCITTYKVQTFDESQLYTVE